MITFLYVSFVGWFFKFNAYLVKGSSSSLRTKSIKVRIRQFLFSFVNIFTVKPPGIKGKLIIGTLVRAFFVERDLPLHLIHFRPRSPASDSVSSSQANVTVTDQRH
jgi:hypothetical protein